MSDVRILNPQPAIAPRPKIQCDVVLEDDPSWAITRKEAYGPKSDRRSMMGSYKIIKKDWDPQSCQRYAEYEIDGHLMCRSHAGRYLLDQAVGVPLPWAFRENKEQH